MIKKIAKKSLLILLLFIITIYGVLTPLKNVQLEPNTCSAAFWDVFRPKVKDSDTQKQEHDQDWCPDCSAPVEGMTIWRMFVAPIDTLLSLVPRLLVFISKWIVILFANILQNAMKPRNNSFLDGINRFTGEGNVARWLWQNSLYFSNILITLFLIWIAISIILEKKAYTSYQNLTKLLVVALLINFSLVICTLLVDISNYVAALFMSGVNGQAFSCVYACAIHKVANSFNCVADKMILSQTIQNSLALVVAIIFIGQLLGLIIFVFTRMIYLWFLVGVSPLAIVMSAIPETEGIYKKWLGLFQTNLIKLPAIAAATYFILNIILFIANKSMYTYVEQGDIMEHVLVTTFVIIILSQGLLMAAQAIGVEQVAKMSAAVNGAVKKGWDAVRKPVVSAGMKRFTSWKPVQKTLDKVKQNRVPIIGGSMARMANRTQDQAKQEQDKTQKEIDYYKDNNNYGQLELSLRNASRSGDKAKFLQSYEAISDLQKQGKWKGKKDILAGHQGQVKDLMEQDIFKRSEAGKKLRDSDLYIDSGPGSSDYLADAKTAAAGTGKSRLQILKDAQELAATRPFQDMSAKGSRKYLDDMEDRVNDRNQFKQTNWANEFERFFNAMDKNGNHYDVNFAGQKYVEWFKELQRIIKGRDMLQIFNKVKDKTHFWEKLATMAIRADRIEKSLAGTLVSPIPAGTPINAIDVTALEIRKNAEQALIDLAPNHTPQNSWMANNGIKKVLQMNGLIA